MVTKEQVYDATLNSLNTVWAAVSTAADSWAKTPNMASAQATLSVKSILTMAANDIRAVMTQLSSAEKKARTVVDDVVIRLDAYKKALAGVASGEELVDTWKRSVQSMLDDMMQHAPEVLKQQSFQTLLRKLAA